MNPQKNEYWVVDVQMTQGSRMMRLVVQIYRVDKSGDIGFIAPGDETVYWRSQFQWFDPIRKVDME